jgi:hypothetical protein
MPGGCPGNALQMLRTMLRMMLGNYSANARAHLVVLVRGPLALLAWWRCGLRPAQRDRERAAARRGGELRREQRL